MKNIVRIVAVLLGLSTLALAQSRLADGPLQNHKFSADLQFANPNDTMNVIVQFKHQPTERHHQSMRNRGGKLRAGLDAIKAGAYSIPAARLSELADDPDVAYVSPDRTVWASMDLAGTATNASLEYQYGFDGNGVTVAVIDSGIMDSHPDLMDSSNRSRVVYSESFNLAEGNDYFDRYGHGTFVSGILGGDASKSTGSSYTRTFRGIAPKVRLVNLKVLDRQGTGTDSMVIAAIARAIQLKSTYNIRVINLSLGRPAFESYLVDPLCLAVEAAWQAGIVVVVAGGNLGRNVVAGTNGYGTITAPGNDPAAITVGAMKTMGTGARGDDRIASYSSKGPTGIDRIVKPDLVAPGNKIVAAMPAGLTLTNTYPGNRVFNSYYIKGGIAQGSDFYYQMSGTSMAAPMVSGAVALLLQANPSLTPDQVKARLMRTASKSFPASSVAIDPATGKAYTSYYDIFTVGAGYLDIAAALNDNKSFTGWARSPKVSWNPTSRTAVLNCASSICGIWSNGELWGDAMFINGTGSLWGSGELWGDGSMWGEGSLWGDSSLWGDRSTWNAMTKESAYVFLLGEN